MQTTIDINKTYRTRDGRTVTDLRKNLNNATYPFVATIGDDTGRYTYTADGHYLLGAINEYDLIEVITPPKPAPRPTFDPTKPVRTNDGRPARIICTDRVEANYPVLALVTSPTGREVPRSFTLDGSPMHGSTRSGLENIPVTKTHFVNLGQSYDNLDSAKRGGDPIYRHYPVAEIVTEGDRVVSTVIHPPGLDI